MEVVEVDGGLVGFGVKGGGSVSVVVSLGVDGRRARRCTQRSLGSRLRGVGARVGASSGSGARLGSSVKATVEGGRGGKLEIDGSEADAGMTDAEEDAGVGDTRGARYDTSIALTSASAFAASP